MFTETCAVFYHCVSPVHLGSGTALGVIDNPIQRERHSDFPVFAGSGIKGALRHHAQGQAKADLTRIEAVFGPATENGSQNLYAGALSFTDAQLLLFPVRSAKQGFAYVTCPLALGTAKRLLSPQCRWVIPSLGEGSARRSSENLGKEKVALELFEFTATSDNDTIQIGKDLSACFPPGEAWAFFREKVASDLLIVSNADFTYFVRNATSVEPHVAIDDETGAADGGKLFYTENLPPESVLVGLLMASATRVKAKKDEMPFSMKANDVSKFAVELAAGLVQIGGDATTGRGQVVMHFDPQASIGGAQ